MTSEQISAYLQARAKETKKFGYTYVHAGMRNCQNIIIDGIRYHIGGYGRSLEHKNGHKYKVTAINETN